MFKVIHKHYVHEGGTKDYDLWLIVNESGEESFMIRRWGKIGANGQSMQRTMKGDGTSAFYAECDKREKKGYGESADSPGQYFAHDRTEVEEDIPAIKYAPIASHLKVFLERNCAVTNDLSIELENQGWSEEQVLETKRPECWGTW